MTTTVHAHMLGSFRLYHDESLYMLHQRWIKLLRDLFDRKRDCYDISKVPDIYDCLKYDCTHNSQAA